MFFSRIASFSNVASFLCCRFYTFSLAFYKACIRIPSLTNFGSRVITAATSAGLAAGSLLADRAEASPVHRSADIDVGIAPLKTLGCPFVLERRNGADRRADRRRTNYI